MIKCSAWLKATIVSLKVSFFVLLFFTLLFNNQLIACKHPEKGFEALSEYNYFLAKKHFEKALKKHPSAASYGLSMIYFRNDNPFHNLELAYHFSLKALERFEEMRPRKKEKLRRLYGFSERRLINHRNNISATYFEIAKKKNTIPAYVDFMARNPWSPLIDSAIFYREELAFLEALDAGTSKAYQFFLRYYGESRFAEEIATQLTLAQYLETTADESIASFERFIEIFPNNPYVIEAHNEIYERLTKDLTIANLDFFVANYPNNPNIGEAWSLLYQLATADYSKSSIERFLQDYPDFPFKDQVESDLNLVEQLLLPFKRKELFGYMDENGKVVIGPKFEYAGLFNNGLAAVARKGKVGYVNKSGEVMIPFDFDDAQEFQEGRAIVEINGLYGLIDRTGNYVLPPSFEDIGVISQGVFYALKEGKYRYYTVKGDELFDIFFDEAYNFVDGLAKVAQGNQVGFIQLDGKFFIQVNNADLRPFSDSIFVAEFRDSVTLIHVNGKTVLPHAVTRIGTLNENRAIIEKNGMFGFIDQLGKIVIPIEWKGYPNYFQFAQFKNGHAKIAKDGKYGLINRNGKRVFAPVFTNIGDFGSLTPVTKGNKWGYADTNTRLQIRYIYDYAYGFQDGHAIVQSNANYGLINLAGDVVLPIDYKEITRLRNGFLQVSNGEAMALFKNDGSALTDFSFSRFNWINDDILQLESEEQIVYYYLPKEKLINVRK